MDPKTRLALVLCVAHWICPACDQLVFIINVTSPQSNCHNCKNRGMPPEEDFDLDIQLEDGQNRTETSPTKAAEFMRTLGPLVSRMTGHTAAVSLGATKGVLIQQKQADMSEVSVGFTSTNNTVLVSVFRFNNMGKNEMNSTVLLNEVIAIDMGTNITNLTDTISIHFRNVTEKGTPSCRSWNGEGSLPTWTESGCETLVKGDSIACHCSHLTFFAVIMSPLNTTISAADLKSLTYITYIGCGLSMFFLGVAFFMHFLTRRTKASKSKEILIQLMVALFLLDLCFLTNTWVADFHSTTGCLVMAALMHYSMLATFTWFAMNAFHLCLHFYSGGKIVARRYVLKVSVAAWVTPSLVVVILLILGKYGELAITTDGNEIAMCWITNYEIHYIINIFYYAVVFLFTFTTLILVLSWLRLTKKSRVAYVQMGDGSSDMVSLFGLCCSLGVSWGVAFFAYGVLQLPSYYIFTILNSFQGFFLFIYYYKTCHKADEVQSAGGSGGSSSSQNTTKVTE
ncbi:hypothetical protein NHX12_026417 [Muraenolepis orangiensis]|uniref:Uncharacterized protein n=1 Tax=Muraenolepis orangiensis TaxID=630683 RepID=A0A9Q0EHC8_9TELE|nr:hypothetical protein NHX12_026417 [Muraenolepis orangiensis]